jgi:hypothetical protein
MATSDDKQFSFLTGGVNTSDRSDKTHFFENLDAPDKPLCGKKFVRIWNLDANLVMKFGNRTALGGPSDGDLAEISIDDAFTDAFEFQYAVCRHCLKILRTKLQK